MRRTDGAVVYWPPTRPSSENKKCTCVNNRYIGSRNIRIWPWLSRCWIECEIVMLAGRRVGVKLIYNPGGRKFKSVGDPAPSRGDPQAADWAVAVGDKILLRELATSRGGPQDPQFSSCSWREDAGIRTMSQRGWAPRSPVEHPMRTGKKRCHGHKSGGQYVAALFGLQLPLTHNPFNKVRGIFF